MALAGILGIYDEKMVLCLIDPQACHDLDHFSFIFPFFSYFSLDKRSYSLASPKDQSRDPETSLCNNCTVEAHGHLTHGRR